jgi:hypothetical protein
LIFSLYLNHSHHDSVNHVDRLAFFFLLVGRLLFFVWSGSTDHLVLMFLFVNDLHSDRMVLESLVSVRLAAELLLVAFVGLVNECLLVFTSTLGVTLVLVNEVGIRNGL